MYYIFVALVLFVINLFLGLLIVEDGSFWGEAFVVIMAVDSAIIIFFIRQYLVEFRKSVEKMIEEKSNEIESKKETVSESNNKKWYKNIKSSWKIFPLRAFFFSNFKFMLIYLILCIFYFFFVI